jgi:queuine tRNA-ribosyltransferase
VVRIRNRRWERDYSPLDRECGCLACRRFSRAYLRHLYCRGEILGPVLGTIHNLTWFQNLLAGIRNATRAGQMLEFQRGFRASGPWGSPRDAERPPEGEE